MDISNKALAIFLLAAVVVSMGGTIASLNQLQKVKSLEQPEQPIPTAFATSANGNVSLNIQGSLSITTADSNTINFGSCSPLSGVAGIINSENASTTNTSQICPSFVQNNISVRNDGNVNANVTVRPSAIGAAQAGSFLTSGTLASAIGYMTVQGGRGGYSNGCMGGFQALYVNFSSTVNNVTTCNNLTYGAVNNSVLLHTQVIIPNDAPLGQADVTLTFVGHNGP
jgi:hypothetical protein